MGWVWNDPDKLDYDEIIERHTGNRAKYKKPFLFERKLLPYSEEVLDHIKGWKSFLVDPPPHYSSDIAAAWEVVEKFKDWSLIFNTGTGHRAGFPRVGLVDGFKAWAHSGDTKTAPLAICLAALKAMNIPIPK